MQKLLAEVMACKICSEHLPNGANPVIQSGKDARIVIIGQAPGRNVHQSGIPWDDPSGKRLREWLGLDKDYFYDASKIALVPMGFCYPGKGRSGDMPPRPECAPQWHNKLLKRMKKVELTLLIGQYAQGYYLKESVKSNLTETVKAYNTFLPDYFPLPHPSPRNRFWLAKNPWFEQEVIPILQEKVKDILVVG